MNEYNKYLEVFFWDFSIKNNLNFNLEIVDELIQDSKSKESPIYFKVISLLLASIVESIMYDHLRRCRDDNRSTFDLQEEKIEEYISKKIEIENNPFKRNLQICKKYELLGAVAEDLYVDLDFVREVRNRIHSHSHAHDRHFWKKDNVKKIGHTLKKLIVILGDRFPRADHFHPNADNTRDFPEPWNDL